MTKLFGKSMCFLVALGLISSASCTLSDPDTTIHDPALTLEYTQDYSLTHFSWDKVKVTGFKEYILLQSNQPIPNNPTPVVNQDVTVLKRITEVDVNHLMTSNLLVGQQTCYKLYCAVDNRFLYSQSVCFDQSYLAVDGFNDKAAHLAGLDDMIGYDRVNDKFNVFNYKTGNVTNTVNDNTLNFPSLEMYQWNGATHVIGFNQSAARLGLYQFPSMTATQAKSYPNVLWAARPLNQFILIASQESGNNFQVLNRNTFLPLDSRSGTQSSQNMAVFTGDPSVVLTLGQSGSKKYLVSANGFITSEQSILGRIGQPDLQHTCAQGLDLFICGSSGNIINKDGENVASLTISNNSFITMSRLSSDESKAIYIITRNGLTFLEIADISGLPTITVERTIELPILTYSDLIPDEGIIHVIGTTFNSNFPETFILKYPW